MRFGGDDDDDDNEEDDEEEDGDDDDDDDCYPQYSFPSAQTHSCWLFDFLYC